LTQYNVNFSGIGISLAEEIKQGSQHIPSSQPRLYVDFSIKYNRIYSQVHLRGKNNLNQENRRSIACYDKLYPD